MRGMMYTPIAFFDPPLVVDTGVTPIPGNGSAPLQVIANTGINVGIGIVYTDATNEFIGVYTGKAGAEILVCIIGGGLSAIGYGPFPPKSRVSLRSMTITAITQGRLSGNVVTG